MKNNNWTAAKQASWNAKKEKELQIKRLMRVAIDVLDDDTDKLLELFQEVCIEKSYNKYLIDKMKEMVAEDGYSIVKTDSINDEYLLKDFVRKNISISQSQFEHNCLFN